MSPKSLQKNVVYNLVGVLVPLLVTIVTVPLYLRAIGEARFGVMSLIWLLFSYFGLFDFGLSRATANRLAQLRGGDPHERAAVFHTALAMNAMLGCVAGAAFYFAALPLLTYLSSSTSNLATELPSALPWIAALFPLAMVGGVFTGSLEAEERFLAINLQQIVGTVLIQFLPLLAVLSLGASIQFAVMGAVIARVISVTWSATLALLSMPRAGRPEIRWDLGRSLLKYGGWVALTNMISPLLVSADQFIIATMLGVSAIAHYSVPFGLAMKTLIVPGSLTRAMFPRLSSLHGEAANDLADRASATLAGVMALVCAPAIVLSNVGLTLWVGAEFASPAAPVAELLLLGTWINGLAFVPFALLQGQGRPDIVAKFHAAEVIPFLAILWSCIALFGLPGAALAWVLRVFVDAMLLFWATGNFARRLRTMALPGLIVIASWIGTVVYQPRPVAAVIAAALLSFGILVFILTNDPAARLLLSRLPLPRRRVDTL